MMNKDLRLKEKVALITGASQGFGRNLARQFCKEGASLALLSRNEEKLSELRKELCLSHREQQILTMKKDLSELSDIPDVIDEIVRRFGRLDVLVNNAGILGPIGPAWENDWDAWTATLTVNLLASVRLCNSAVKHMKSNRSGKIINLSGGGATSPRPRFSAYGTAKAALVRFSETLSEEVKDFGIDVNCIAPGMMNTQMVARVCEAGPSMTGEKEYLRALDCSNGQSDSMERAAQLVVFLASKDSDGITGKLISAVWDPWETLGDHLEEIENSDIYSLRRIVPKDRGFDWGER